MIEIRIHGRGGQGVKKSAQIIARAASLKGMQTQDFAMYGAERQGAPVTSFVRADRKPIETRGYVFEPDWIIVLDDSIEREKTLEGRKEGTKILVNSQDLKKEKGIIKADATSIALKETGRAIANVALLGAFVRESKLFGMKELEKALEIELAKKGDIVQKNLKAAQRVAEELK
ncbi:MAG: 2-oxoacid:acceptor oxidoreductase family protein [Candidatus Diapherotrites archaeon]